MAQDNELPRWIYNEFHASGVDYADLEVVRKFESRHRRFRDFDAEFERIRERTGLSHDDVVLDLGCGSGAFVVPAAKYCRKVYGADVSKQMLTILGEKLAENNLTNVELRNAGLLTFWTLDDCPKQFDFILSSIALHHIPDFWKAVAIQKIADALKPGGVFYLYDVVFTFPIDDWRDGVQRLLDEMEAAAGHEANAHISSEYSAFSWILEGIFERVGLKVEKVIDDSGFLRAYVCRKVAKKSDLVLTTAETREVDVKAAQNLNVPTLILMENAARSLAEVFMANAARLDAGRPPRKILIFCGKGNNGGDGFALFRRLELLGLDCTAVALATTEDYSGDARVNLDIVASMTKESPEKLIVLKDAADDAACLNAEIAQADWIVDAMLGTGASGALRAPYDKIVAMINASGKPIYSVDVPTGLNADDATVTTDAVKATLTTTLAALKPGLMKDEAKEYVGELHMGDIGVPVEPLTRQ